MLKHIIVSSLFLALFMSNVACSSENIKGVAMQKDKNIDDIEKMCSTNIKYNGGFEKNYAFSIKEKNLRLWTRGEEIPFIHLETNSKNFSYKRFKGAEVPQWFKNEEISNSIFQSNKINLEVEKDFLYINDRSEEYTEVYLLKISHDKWVGHIIKYEIIDDLKEIEEKTLDKKIIFESCK